MRSQPLTDQPLPRYPIFPYTEWGSWRREVGEKSARNWTEFGEKLPKCRPTTAAIPYFPYTGWGSWRREVGEKSERSHPGTDQPLLRYPIFPYTEWGSRRREVGQRWDRIRREVAQVQTNDCCTTLFFHIRDGVPGGEKSERSHPGTDQPLLSYPIFPYTE